MGHKVLYKSFTSCYIAESLIGSNSLHFTHTSLPLSSITTSYAIQTHKTLKISSFVSPSPSSSIPCLTSFSISLKEKESL